MNYDKLDQAYWAMQSKRVADEYSQINLRANVSHGSAVPADDDLALGDGCRLKTAILFLDISAFSTRQIETEQEQNAMLQAFNLFFSEMIKIAEDYGGTVEKNTGDGLMAYFEDDGGIPKEGGCKRAIACAQTMFAANEKLIKPILETRHIKPFMFRISINYGYVTIAKIGASGRFTQYVAIGTAANYAAKMLAKASANEIVIGESVKNALPLDWQESFAEVLVTDKGPVIPCNLYRYTGRWI
jgi:adenylate cyclase